MSEVYVSTDIEADGPLPGINSMLSFGSAAFSETGDLIDTFEANLELAPGAVQDTKTMNWWATQKEAWEACRADQQNPETAMKNYVKWLKALPGLPVFVGYPAGYDFQFVYHYLIRFAGESPFSFSALDIKTYAMAVLGGGFRDVNKKALKKFLSENNPHTHVAIEDAIEQGELFINLRNYAKTLHTRSK